MRGRNPFWTVVRPQEKGNRSPNRSRLNSFNPRAAAAAQLSSPPSAPRPSTDPTCQVLLRNLASLRPPPWYYEAEVSDRRRRKRVSLVCLSVHCLEDEAKRLPLILIVYCKQIVPGFIQKKKLCVDGTRTADCQTNTVRHQLLMVRGKEGARTVTIYCV